MLKLKFSNFDFECGTDEAGRGCLAGPVTAAAVILPVKFTCNSINDSKQLSSKKRELIKPIIELEAISFGVAHIFPKKIDEINPKLQYYQITRYIKDTSFDKDPLSWETELILPYKLDF